MKSKPEEKNQWKRIRFHNGWRDNKIGLYEKDEQEIIIMIKDIENY